MLTYGKYGMKFPKDMWTLGTILEYQAEHIGEKTYVQWHAEGEPVTYAETNRIVNRHAHGMLDQGIQKGDVVVLFMKNSLELVWSWYGLSKIGAIETAIDPLYKGNFLVHQVNTSLAKTAIVDYDALEVFKESELRLENLERIFVYFNKEEKALPEFQKIKLFDLADLISNDDTNPGIEVKPRDLMTILWTSGTEGLSKGVMKCHADMTFYTEQAASLLGFTEDDTFLGFNPLFHLAAKGIGMYMPLVQGGRTVFYETFSASEMTERVKKSGATTCLLLPPHNVR